MKLHRLSRTAAASLVALVATAATAAAPPDCAAIGDDADRLRCYDRAAGRAGPEAPSAARAAVSAWEARILQDAAREPFTLTARRPTYLTYSSLSSVNRAPYAFSGGGEAISNEELKLQFSLQTKAADNLFGGNGDLWFSYTQVSYWQAFNGEASSPFRESNYEPEAFVSFLTDYRVLGLRLRAVSAGIVHQSNGRSQPLSRSWNRLYGELQLVRGAFGLSMKPWVRIDRGSTDDNPDIEDYLGRYELRASYERGGHLFGVMLRNALERRYNTELSWSFPIAGRLRGLVQWYNGYGENLIDYNHKNHRLGVGILISDWL